MSNAPIDLWNDGIGQHTGNEPDSGWWRYWPRSAKAELDGEFTADELEAIARQMREVGSGHVSP